MAHFNFVISQNAKWGHAGFYIDCHRMTVPENIFFYKKALLTVLPQTPQLVGRGLSAPLPKNPNDGPRS